MVAMKISLRGFMNRIALKGLKIANEILIMLTLVGLGLWDEKDMLLSGIEACRAAAKVYCELYTAAWGGNLKKLEKTIGKKIEVLERKDVEEDSDKLIEEAKTKDVVVLVPGDPLTATTHIHLIMECKKRGIAFEIIHSSSIYTAVAKTGLQLYKFGRTTTIPAASGKYAATSFFDAIAENAKAGLHTLVLLDRDMGTREGLRILKEVEGRKGKKILKHAVLCSRLGSKRERLVYGEIKALMETDLPPPAVIIIPGKLHFIEKEFLETLR
jgi:diphthine synthase